MTDELTSIRTARLKSVRIQNYRSIVDLSLTIEPVTVLFGPNGAGKSTLLDAISFFQDCRLHGVERAATLRFQGLDLFFDGAAEGEPIRLNLATDRVEYELTLNPSAGRIDPFAGERLFSSVRRKVLFERRAGSRRVDFFLGDSEQATPIDLRKPEELSLERYLDLDSLSGEALEISGLLLRVHTYHSRFLAIQELKRVGSPTGQESWVTSSGLNLWTVLRNLESRRQLDDRYATIMRYMAEAVPTFDGLIIEPTGPNILYASYLEKGRRRPILAFGVSDGHIQILILLAALFCEDRGRNSLILLDEPETSLHPWALAVLARAIREATEKWGRQVILATHSPVLISQFDPDQLLAVESKDGRTEITRLSEIEDIQDLLQEYAAGSLYMSETVAPQSRLIEPSNSGR